MCSLSLLFLEIDFFAASPAAAVSVYCLLVDVA